MAHEGRGGSGRSRGIARWPGMILAVACMSPLPVAIGQGEFRPGFNQARTKVYFDASHKADADLRSADNHSRAGDFAEAIEIYRRVIQQFGDKVVEIPTDPNAGEEDFRLSVNARRECQRRIAALPPEARKIYRDRVDAQAERWFRLGKEARDRAPLRRIVDQSFCSSWGDDALELLGDLAFQEGQFAEAMAAYVQLVPDRPGGGFGLIHPDPSVDLARIQAKKFLCRAAIGDHPPSPSELQAFAAEHPAAPGPFAGRKQGLALDLIEAIRDDHLAPSSLTDGRWSTFGGSPTRTKVAPGPIDVGSKQWSVELDPIQPTRSKNYLGGRSAMGMLPPSPPPSERLLGYHPIVVGDQVIIDNEKQIISYNLNSRPGDQADSGPVIPTKTWHTPDLMGTPLAIRGTSGLARYTLTAFGDRIFARIGQPPSSSPNMNRMGISRDQPGNSYVVAVDRGQGKVLWKREAADVALPKRQAGGGVTSRNAVFEGSPVADGKSVYVAITDRIEMTATYVACLDAENGGTRWIRHVCEANSNIDISNNFEISHRLLTLDGPSIYYQTNLGAVAALDAETGGIRWLATYPWQGRNGLGPGRERDLNPAIVHDGLVIVAPDDTPAIYAFDAVSGRIVWKSAPIADEVKLTHLLGVAKGHLIATGDRVLWIDVKTGKLAHAWPDNNQAAQGYGRGILAGDRIYWPTKTEIHILDQSSGLITDPPIRLQEFGCEGGNLAVGDGYLIVAQASSLVVFCQNSRLIDRYRDEIARAPEQAANYYRLARAAEAIGRDDVALASLETALPRARASESIDGSPLVDVIRDHQRQLLMKLGQKAKASRNWAEAADKFAAAARAAGNDRDRLSSRLELADVQLAQGEARASVATLQALLSDERVRALTVDTPDGHRSVRADLLIADRLFGLLRDQGRELYADFDKSAAEMLARGKADKDPRLLEDVGRSYPAAMVVPDAWRALGELFDEAHRPGDAARAYKRLLSSSADDANRARALWGLARAYEAQKLWVPAREAYLQAQKRFGDEKLDQAGGSRALKVLVAERLNGEPFGRMVGDRSEPSVPVPLRRRWDRHWSELSRPIAAEGVPPSAEAGRVFLAQGREIRPIDPSTGKSPWSRDLDGEPIWVGYLADRIIAATRSKLMALSLDKGDVEWQYDVETAAGAKAGANPFAREAAFEPKGDAGVGPLQDFRIVGNRIFCLRGDQTLMAFDGDSGLLDWSYTPASGKINPHLLVGQRRIVLQVRKPNSVIVLETANGRRRVEFAQPDEEEWPRDPLPVDDDHVALVVSRTKVAKFDTAKGTFAWEYEETKDSPRLGAPRLFCDAERLLVLHEGQNLMRLDLATGAKAWPNSKLLGSEDLSERPEALAIADDRVFVANGPTLSAFALGDGSLIWKRSLKGPGSGWDVALTERSIVAYPGAARLREDGLGVLPLVFHRRQDGEPIQRLLIQATVTDLAIRFSARGALVATQNGLWALGDRQVMDGSKAPR